MCKIIAISAISGGGKTSLVNAAANLLKAEKIFFDDYFTKEYYPKNMRKWLDASADLNLWRCAPLKNALKELKNGKDVTSPKGDKISASKNLILLEEPTGRCRNEVKDLIDFVVVIDTPPEIALARRVLRDFEPIPTNKLNEYPKEDLVKGFGELIDFYKGYFKDYLISGREMYINILDQVKNNSDLIIDFQLDTKQQAEKLKEFLTQQNVL